MRSGRFLMISSSLLNYARLLREEMQKGTTRRSAKGLWADLGIGLLGEENRYQQERDVEALRGQTCMMPALLDEERQWSK